MYTKITDLIIDIDGIDTYDLCSSWRWCLADMNNVFIISKMGDMFFLGKDEGIYWLAIDSGGILTKIAKSLQEFEELLNIYDNIDNWFLPVLVEQLNKSAICLNKNEVYSYKKLPVIGGEYKIDNIEPTDISVHFELTGQICEQIKNLPDGTKVKIVVKE
jgi:hypothetical protein